MKLQVPELSLVVLVGASGSGKSTFAARHFAPTEVISSDFCRALVADDENDLSATADAFEVLHFVAGKRLAAGRLTVVDATNVQPQARRPLVELARRYHCLPVAIVLDLPERLCRDRNAARTDRTIPDHAIRRHVQTLRRGVRGLGREGFRHVHVLRTPEEVEAAEIERTKLWCDRRDDPGPFDVIGDVHGCADELEELLSLLGYERADGVWRHPDGRRAVFVGDLVDRGPRILDTVRLARDMVAAGTALCVPGNHDVKLVRKLRGKDVRVTHGLDRTLAELEALPEDERRRVEDELVQFLDGLTSHYVLDEGRLVVAHAGMREEMQGRGSGKLRDFALYGETTGETDEFGLPVRWDWAASYRGQAMVVYGHTPVPEPEWVNRTINIDTGCVFGGRLTALRYPEQELVSVPARAVYADPIRPLAPEPADGGRGTQQRIEDLLELEDVLGTRAVTTRLMGRVAVREEQAAAALEVMSRFAVDPKWLIYLPPTMSPSETTTRHGLLEHPAESFAYYREQGVGTVVCQEKHMGSRAVVVLCREPEVAVRRFGLPHPAPGVCYTRTGRRFFEDPALEEELLGRLRTAVESAGLWDELDTDWLCLDAEIMPWSAKAQELIKRQYAAAGAAGTTALSDGLESLDRALSSGIDVTELRAGWRDRLRAVQRFVDSYRRYCWPIRSLADLRVAPFHLLASEGGAHAERDHRWHMTTLSRLEDGETILATAYRVVDVTDAEECEEAAAWWDLLTSEGGEGMVVKPLEFVARGRRGLLQPAVKCRGREYLRLVYGPEYTAPENLERLRSRSLGLKRSLAVREFALGIEGLERFARREPLHRVHECAFAVLALESEPVDPRL